MTTPATPITFTLENKGTSDIAIRSISYTNDSRIQHVADYTGIGGSPGDSRPDTVIRYTKTYQYGDYLEKDYQSDSHDRTPTYTTMTGVTLTVSSTEGIQPSWIATGNGLTGRSVVTVTSPTTLTMNGTYTGIPTIGAQVTFSTSTKYIVVSNSTNLEVGWDIIGNGYELAANAVITSINGTTIGVNVLPTNPAVGNPMIFSSTRNNLTLNNNTNLDTSFTAKNNGYNDTQYIIAVLGDGQTVQMDAPPGSVPTAGNPIIFTSQQNLVVIAGGTSVSFSINYTSPGPAGVNYYSEVIINAVQLPSTPLTGHIDNYVNVNNPPQPTTRFVTIYTGGGGGRGGGGLGYTTTVTGYSDGSTMSVTTSNADGSVTSMGATNADPGLGNSDTGVTSVSTFGSNANASDGGGGGGGGGGSRVICTHFYRKGMMSRQVWRADMEYTFNYLSPATVRGYQYWAIPYVRLMRISPLAEKIMYPLMMARAEELAYKMGVLEKGNWFGKLVRLVFEPICFTIGLFVGNQDWKSLWNVKLDKVK